MKLPDLDSLDKEFKAKPKQSKPNSKVIEKETKTKKRKSIIPKTEYHADGTPVLAIPDLDDINLAKEIDKYFKDMKTSKVDKEDGIS